MEKGVARIKSEKESEKVEKCGKRKWESGKVGKSGGRGEKWEKCAKGVDLDH